LAPDLLVRVLRTHEFRLLVVVLLMGAVISVASPGFLTLQNFCDLLASYAFSGILACGLLVVLVSGKIDVSFTATASVAQYVAILIGNAHPEIGILGVLGLAVLIGLALGVVNAALVSFLGMSSIIVTIATLNIFYGFLIFFSGGKYIFSLPPALAAGIYWVFHTDAAGNDYAINLQILSLAAMFVVTGPLLRFSNLGRQIYAVGSNAEAARRMGVSLFRINLVVFGFMGVAAGVASIVQAQLAQTVMPMVLVGRELDVLAAVVLGGASLAGGTGTVTGTALGLVLLAILQNGLILLRVPSYWSQFSTGIVIVAAVSLIALRGSHGGRPQLAAARP
jgi:simple sugar transport system permease protein